MNTAITAVLKDVDVSALARQARAGGGMSNWDAADRVSTAYLQGRFAALGLREQIEALRTLTRVVLEQLNAPA